MRALRECPVHGLVEHDDSFGCPIIMGPERCGLSLDTPADYTPAAALRESAETLHRVSPSWEHAERTFEKCPAESCVKARAALGGQ